MNIYGHLRAAEDMELHKGFAIQARKRYLNSRVNGIWQEIYDLDGWVDGMCDINSEFAFQTINLLVAESVVIAKELKSIKTILRVDKNDITDNMIEIAKSYPVDKLIDFTRGKATAFCHEDRHPTMYHATRNNTANCPACNEVFGSIDILMKRDGLNFVQAVRQLN